MQKSIEDKDTVKLYKVEQVREMERLAIEENNIPGITLMREAGRQVFELIKQHYAGYELIVVCGAGNNAGDGYVVARLALEAGYKVTVFYLSAPEKLKSDALTAYQDFVQVKGIATKFTQLSIVEHGLIVDALFGTGLCREVSGNYADVIEQINASTFPVIAVDIPSGLNADAGCVWGLAVKANYTVSFIGLKQGMYSGYAAEYCGKIIFSSLGIPEQIYQQLNHSATQLKQYYLPKRHRCAHKGYYGHVLVIGGDEGYSGAITLAAEVALRIGAGLVSIATRKCHASLINNHRPELMCHGIANREELKVLIDKSTVILIGPGLGQSQWAMDLLNEVMVSDKKMVVDADALNLLAKQQIFRNNWVLTPHPGEAARLLANSTLDIANDRFAAVSQIQQQYGGVAVLKGAGTLISNADEISISTTGNPGMASGGMGDTLAGMIAGLMAQGLSLHLAAQAAVYWHGKAADLAAQENGEVGMLASDLMPFIRQLVNQ